MPVLEFVGQSKAGQTARPATTSRLINLFREPVEEGGLTRYLLRPVQGRIESYDLGSVFIRQMAWVDSTIYIAAGGSLYSATTDASAITTIGAIKDSTETTISGSSGYVTVCAGGKYYVSNGGSLSEPTPGAFSDFGSVETLENFTLLTERNGRRIQWSNPADPETLGGLDFATTESGPDNNIRGMALNGNYWVFKDRSIEIWYPTGISDAAFARVGGGVIETGLKAFNLVAKARDSLFFVGSDGIVYIAAGQGLQPISNRAVERDLREKTPTHTFYTEREGHKFCTIRFSDRPAWVYDIATGEWHERSEGVNHGAFDAVASVESNLDQWLVASEIGKIYRLDNVQTDKGQTLHRRAISHTLRVDSKRFRVSEAEIYGAYGYSPVQPQTDYFMASAGGYFPLGDGFFSLGSSGEPEPKLMLSVSRDGGATWGAERMRGLGAQGEYEQRVLLRALGQFRLFTLRVDMTHAHEIPLYADGRVRVS